MTYDIWYDMIYVIYVCYETHTRHVMCQATKPALIQNRFCIKTGFASSIEAKKWICPKTGQYKTCIVSNTKIEASLRATKPKPRQ